MSHAVPEVPQAPQSVPELPLIILYQSELASLNAQRDQARVNLENAKAHLEHLNGAIFACEQFIKMYEDHAKQGAAKFIKDAANSLKPVENLGEINDGQAKCESKEKVA